MRDEGSGRMDNIPEKIDLDLSITLDNIVTSSFLPSPLSAFDMSENG
eukprot:CAMPEP_0196155226 /NCGR_PEP_ID=MMETSP0910-20130528/40250_1 /TAXON_ID=49265 /ORGANISM="Thalassiosira rotula, Strain GSO102" /LENGTH=46 /DNA_ID= /DNA_START= /DNA_END= /DNA_ORIENTATION=